MSEICSMDPNKTAIAEACLHAAESGTMDFPQIVMTLVDAGFESYGVDFRRGTAIYYTPDGDSIELPAPAVRGPVAKAFNADAIQAAIREAQTNAPGYTYLGFGAKVRAAGCASYTVSFLGRRAVYYGRSAESHVEPFPAGP
jgi:uncharacterized protein YbcV (DUF1398 family)